MISNVECGFVENWMNILEREFESKIQWTKFIELILDSLCFDDDDDELCEINKKIRE